MQKITPCLWFNKNAEEAVDFYCNIFPHAKITNKNHYPAGAPMPEGMVMTITFQLDVQEFMALNAGPEFQFTEAISMMVKCKTQEEIDFYWDKLLEGGQESQCGWLKDKFGLSWQIIPDRWDKFYNDKEPVRSMRVMQVMLKMKKLDLGKLERAFEGEMD